MKTTCPHCKKEIRIEADVVETRKEVKQREVSFSAAPLVSEPLVVNTRTLMGLPVIEGLNHPPQPVETPQYRNPATAMEGEI